MKKPQLKEHEGDIYKSGIGDNFDLQPLTEYSREHTEDFQVDFTLAGKKLVDSDYYPKLDVNFSMQAQCKRNKVVSDNPATYDIDVNFIPELKARYALNVLDPVYGNSIDSYINYASVRETDGKKSILSIDAEGSELIDRKVMTFTQNAKMVTKEVGVYNVYRYSNLKKWNELSNKNITCGESPPTLIKANWNIRQEIGMATITSRNHRFSFIQDSQFDAYNDFIVSADVEYNNNRFSSLINDNGLVGLAFCIKDSNNFYFAGFDNKSANPDIILFKVTNGTKKVLSLVNDYSNISILSPSLYRYIYRNHIKKTIKVDILHDVIKVYINDKLVIEYNDSNRINAGGFGLAGYRTNNVTFSNITFDRYITFEKGDKDEFLKRNESEKVLHEDSFDSWFLSEYLDRINNNENIYSSYSDVPKNELPDRTYHKFSTKKLKASDFINTDSHTVNHSISTTTDWVSPLSRENTISLRLKVKEEGVFDDASWWLELFGLDQDEYEYRFDYSIYYKEENSSSWTRLSRKNHYSEAKHKYKTRNFSIDNLEPGRYQWKIVQHRKPSKRLIVESWKDSQSSWMVNSPCYVSEKVKAFVKVSNSNFVKGNESTNFNDIPKVELTGVPAITDYHTCDVEVKDISIISDEETYPAYNNPLSFEWLNSETQITSSENDTLNLSTNFIITKNITGTTTEPLRIDMPDLNSEYPELNDFTYHDNNDLHGEKGKIKVSLTNNNNDVEIMFEMTQTKETINHPINSSISRGEDKIIIMPNPEVITTSIVVEPWSSDKQTVKGIVNGYFDTPSGKEDYIADLIFDDSSSSKRIDIMPNRGKGASILINFPNDVDTETILYNLSIESITYTRYTLFDKTNIIPDEVVIVGETGNKLVGKIIEHIPSERANILYQSTDSPESENISEDTIKINSDFKINDNHLEPWQSTITLDGLVSLKQPIWERVVPNIEDGESLESLFSIPENDIGEHYCIVECTNSLLSSDYIKVDEGIFKALVKLTNVMNWQPHIHNGYFYLANENNSQRPTEYYLYAIPEMHELPEVLNNTEYSLDSFYSNNKTKYPKQLSPIIVEDSKETEFRRVVFFDENFNPTLTNKEKVQIKKEISPVYVQAIDKDGFEINAIKIKDNKIYFSDTYVTPGDILEINYSYLNSKERHVDLEVSNEYYVELPDSYINSIYLTYADIEPTSLVIKDQEDNIIDYKEINNNFIEIETNYNREGEEINVSYQLKNSFLVDVNKDVPTIIFSNDYPDGVTITYENANTTSYYKEDELNLNPHINNIQEGFIFITNRIPILGEMMLNAYPDVIFSDGKQSSFLKINLIDVYNNPYYNPNITEPVSIGCDHGSISFIDYAGNSIPSNEAYPDIYGNVYAIYNHDYSSKATEDLIWAHFGDMSASKEIKINKRIIKDNLDNSGQTDDSTTDTKEYHIIVTPEKNMLLAGEITDIDAKVYDNNLNPISKVDITFEIKNTSLEDVQTVTASTNNDGIATIVFHKDYVISDIDVYNITAHATVNGIKITDMSGLTVTGLY